MIAYLDNNATTQPADEVVEVMLRCLRDQWGNPSSTYRFGQSARHSIDVARGQIAELVGCAESELLFTGCGTESINTALHTLIESRGPRRKVITSSVEHSATRETLQLLQRLERIELIELSVDPRGQIDLHELKSQLDGASFVSLIWANNETGVVFPIEQIAQMCRDAKVPLHVDATQMIGKMPINLREAGIDLASFSPHKFHGPKGVGCLFARRGIRVIPIITGGPQERARRGGTENVAGIVGAGVAAELAASSLPEMRRVAALRDRLEASILSTVPDTQINGDTDHRLPNTTNIGFAPVSAEAIIMALSEHDICVSAGAACSSGSLEPSHVLQAMKVDPRFAHGSIRFSLSRYSTDRDVERTLEKLPGIIQRLRSVMPR